MLSLLCERHWELSCRLLITDRGIGKRNELGWRSLPSSGWCRHRWKVQWSPNSLTVHTKIHISDLPVFNIKSLELRKLVLQCCSLMFLDAHTSNELNMSFECMILIKLCIIFMQALPLPLRPQAWHRAGTASCRDAGTQFLQAYLLCYRPRAPEPTFWQQSLCRHHARWLLSMSALESCWPGHGHYDSKPQCSGTLAPCITIKVLRLSLALPLHSLSATDTGQWKEWALEIKHHLSQFLVSSTDLKNFKLYSSPYY